MTPPEGLAPKSPPGWARWEYQGHIDTADLGRKHVWVRGRMLVLSSLIEAEFHGQPRWQWLISASVRGALGKRHRPTDEELSRVLRDFDMRKAEEDNHSPGVARAFFLLCDAKPEDPVACECKETEETVVEPDGYAWQKDKDVSAEQKRAEMEALQRVARMRE